MSDDEELADASWAADILSDEDWVEMQTLGADVVAAAPRQVFALAIYKDVNEAKALVEAYIAVGEDGGTEEQLDMLRYHTHGVMRAFYEMCVSYGNLAAEYWLRDDEN